MHDKPPPPHSSRLLHSRARIESSEPTAAGFQSETRTVKLFKASDSKDNILTSKGRAGGAGN